MVGRPFEKGTRRTGRAKGTPNKTTLTIREQIEAITNGEPLPVILARIGLKAVSEGDYPTGGKILNDAARYAYPTLKQVEHQGEIQSGPAVVVNLTVSNEPEL